MSFFFLQFPILTQSIFRPFLIPLIAFTTFHFTLFYFICPRLSVATHESRDRQIRGVIKLLRCAGLDTAVFCQLCFTNLSSFSYLCQTAQGRWPATMFEGSLPFSQMGPDAGVRTLCVRIK